MKQFLLLITILTAGFSFSYAQEVETDPAKSEQKIKALYVAYITQQLNLNEEEAQKFWPVHKQFESDLKAVDQNLPELPRQQAALDIKKRYQERFTKILGSSNRTDSFFRVDNEFRRKLVDKLRNMRQQNNRPQRPPRRNNQ
jgi:hypothetical protein